MADDPSGVPQPTHPSFVPLPVVPFPPWEALRPPAVLEPSPSAYVLVQTTGPVDPSECEDPGAEAVEVTVLWGTNVLSVRHLSPPRAFYVGQAADVDYQLPAEHAPFQRAAIVELRGGRAHAVAPHGAALEGATARPGTESAVALERGVHADVVFGELCFRIVSVAAGKRVPRALGANASGFGLSLATSFAAAAAFLGALAYYTPALGASLDDELDRDQLATLRVYLDALAEREQKRPPAEAGDSAAERGGGTPGQAARGPEGKMGRRDRPDTRKRTAIQGSGERALSRQAAIVEAQTFGMVGMLASLDARALPTAIWGADQANGPDASDAWGNLYGEEIGESAGSGGLGLSGPGQGGGQRGDWIGIGSIGTCGTNCGAGPGDKGGFGRGVGATGKGHKTSGPQLRSASMQVSGRLPPELIQRVVRQNYGRFRVCYEAGLRGNPNLTGRVTARFVIGRDGAVANVANGGSDLPDASVVSCVLSAFYGLSFPGPENGVVSVSYPILLTPS